MLEDDKAAVDSNATTFKARKTNSPSFKGKNIKVPSGNKIGELINKFDNWVGKTYAKYYALPLTNRNWVHNLAQKFTKIPGDMIEHMATLGSAITSGVYMARTLENKDLDDEKKKTLAINQGLCFVIPTIGAYTVNHFLLDFKKNLGYGYSGFKEQQKALGKLSPKKLAELESKHGDRLKGIGPLASLFTFTLIYRYITPVLVTPFANWLGNKLYGEDSKKAKEIDINTQPTAKEIALNNKENNVKVA